MFEETAGDLAELDAESPDQYSPAIRHRPDTSGAGPWPAKLLNPEPGPPPLSLSR